MAAETIAGVTVECVRGDIAAQRDVAAVVNVANTQEEALARLLDRGRGRA